MRIVILTVVVLLAACGREAAIPTEAAQHAALPEQVAKANPAKGIAWFDGSVDEAFAAAKAGGKPIYLYWGAEWCPPCHLIAATVFRSPEFIERSKLFVPVYLDGDTANAQAVGERFGVLGYPTMIVFSPDGDELTRIPGGIDLQAYANVLDLTLGKTAGVSELVAGVLQGDTGLAAADCRLLAYYSWGQDPEILADVDAAAAFRQMFEACPAASKAERSILYMNWLEARLNAVDGEEDGSPLTAAEQAEALGQVVAMLADDELIKANTYTVPFQGARFTKMLTAEGSAAEAKLIDAFLNAYDRMRADDKVLKELRIYTLIGRLRFERLRDDDAAPSDELRERIRATVAWADETTPSIYERQSIVNALANVLDESGMDDVARPLLLKELDVSKQPYYFMAKLGDIEQRAGNIDQALDWFRLAHETARGPATRFQWGYYYVASLLEMTPDDGQRIYDVTVGLIDELQNSMGLYQRPKAQLGRLDRMLQSWSDEYGQQDTLARIRESVLEVCAAAAIQGDARTTCESFLGGA